MLGDPSAADISPSAYHYHYYYCQNMQLCGAYEQTLLCSCGWWVSRRCERRHHRTTVPSPLSCIVLYITHIYNLWSLKKDFPFGQSQKWLRASNIQQHIKLWTVSTPFGGCYYAIELTLLIKMLRTSFEEMRPDIQSINENLRYTFLSGNQKVLSGESDILTKLKSSCWRIRKRLLIAWSRTLEGFVEPIVRNMFEIFKFVYVDASLFESMATEILSTVAEVDFALKHLHSWTNLVFTAYPTTSFSL
jgi:hypothetical protein